MRTFSQSLFVATDYGVFNKKMPNFETPKLSKWYFYFLVGTTRSPGFPSYFMPKDERCFLIQKYFAKTSISIHIEDIEFGEPDY